MCLKHVENIPNWQGLYTCTTTDHGLISHELIMRFIWRFVATSFILTQFVYANKIKKLQLIQIK